MKTLRKLTSFACLAGMMTTLCLNSRAQTATWTSPGPDTEWNTATNWDIGVPAEGTNAAITTGTANYNLPMVPTSFAGLNLSVALSVNTNGFNIVPTATNLAAFTVNSGGIWNIGSSGVVTITSAGTSTVAAGGIVTNAGTIIITNSGPITLANNGASPVSALTLNTNSSLIMTNTQGSAGINVGSSGNAVGTILTINGGTLTADKLVTVAGTASRLFLNSGTLNCFGGSRVNDTGNDNAQRFGINGGVANLGNFSVYRSTSAGGLVVSNGVVNATGIQIGVGNAASFGSIFAGVITNTGVFTISDNTNAASSSDRRSQFLVRGGAVVSTSPTGIIIANLSHTNPAVAINNTVIGGLLDINAGSVTAEAITLIRDTTITNAYARLQLSGSGIIYLGSGGLVANVGAARTAFNIVPSGGTFAAKADWSSSAPLPITGTVTFQAADALGAAHNISLSGVISSSGILSKTGAGTLTLNTNETYTGNTLISGGTLALGVTGTITNNAQFILSNGAVYDVSAAPGYALVGSQALSGVGSVKGSLTANSGNSIRPAGSGAAGTLVFSNALSESGGVLNGFDLSDDPTGTIKTNDFINVLGDLNLSGTNSIQVNTLNGPLAGGSTYKLIHYGGNLTGGATNFSTGSGVYNVAVDTGAKTISLVVASAVRGATNVTWLGNAASNIWDMVNNSNWLNGVTRDYFVAGDNARFDNTGATNPLVTVSGSVLPASVVVDSISNYTFTGSGSVDGTGGLTKTNSGTLTILTTNNYPGPTIIGQGTLEAGRISASSTAGSIGVTSADPSNLVFYGSTLRYVGGNNATTDRGATLNGTGATLSAASNSATLTINGTVTGPGGVTVAGPGTVALGGVNSYAGVTTVSNGTLQINNAVTALGTNTVVFAGGTLSMNVGSQPTYPNVLDVVANSSLISSGGNNNIVTGQWFGSNTLNVSVASGTFTINADMGTNFSGTIFMGNSAGVFRFNGGGGNPATGNDNATFDLGTNTVTLNNRNGASVVYRLGGLAGGPGTLLRGAANAGSPCSYQIGGNNLSSIFSGSIQNGLAGQTNPQPSAAVSILKIGTGTLTLAGTNSYNGSTTLIEGELALTNTGSIGSSPIINLVNGNILDVSGRTDGTLTLNSGQTLQGFGTIRGSLTAANGSVITPDQATNGVTYGTINVTNAAVFQTGCNISLEVDTSIPTNDLITAKSITYGGTLTLSLFTTLSVGNSLKLFDATNYSGAFGAISPPTPGFGLSWDTSHLTTDGTLRVTVQRPVITAVVPSGTDLNISGTGGTAFNNYYILASTNAALPVSQWTPIATNQFLSDGSFSFTTTMTNAAQNYYLIHEP